MKIAICLNDVIRDVSSVVEEAYKEHSVKYEDLPIQYDLTDTPIDVNKSLDGIITIDDDDVVAIPSYVVENIESYTAGHVLREVEQMKVEYNPEDDFMGYCKQNDFKFENAEDYVRFMFEDYKFNFFAGSKVIANSDVVLNQFIKEKTQQGDEVYIVINDNYSYDTITETLVNTKKGRKLKEYVERVFLDLTYQSLYWLGVKKINVSNVHVVYSNKELETYDLVVSADPNYKHENKVEITKDFTFLDFYNNGI